MQPFAAHQNSMLPMQMQNFANPQQANAAGPANTLAALASLGSMGENAV